MKRIVLSVAAVIMFSGCCFAQAGNNQVGVGGSADFLLSRDTALRIRMVLAET